MGQIYTASFQRCDGVVQPLGEAQVIAPEALKLPPLQPDDEDQGRRHGRWYGVGPAFGVYTTEMLVAAGAGLAGFDPLPLPQARHALVLAEHALLSGQGVDATEVLPLYVRNQVTG
jgi:tRNA A37 threonylcarbamoyladenosine modification protein TsaB